MGQYLTPEMTLQINRETNHRALLEHTKALPMRTISIGGKPYLERYYLNEDEYGNQGWLHHYLSHDGENFLHSHPWNAVSNVLVGSYEEEVLLTDLPKAFDPATVSTPWNYSTAFFTFIEGDKNLIEPSKIHRISNVHENTWTLLTVAPERLDEWFFIDVNGNKIFEKTSPKDWWKSCSTRGNATNTQ